MARSHEPAEMSLAGLDHAVLLGDASGAPQALSIGVEQSLLLLAAWIVIGAAGALALERQGHDLRSLIGIATVLGPLFLPLAVRYVRDRHTSSVELVPTPDVPGRRAIIVLLGRPEAVADARPLLDSTEGISRLTLATTINYESARRREWDEHKQEAGRRLQQAAVMLDGHEAGHMLLPGTIEHNLPRLAASADDLIVLVGDAARRRADKLGSPNGVPVICVPPTNRR